MTRKCTGCGSILQTTEKGMEGYVNEKVYNEAKYCERCFKVIHYGEASIIDKEVDKDAIIKKVNRTHHPVIYIASLLTFNSKCLDVIKNIKTKVYLVLTKRDLLPKSVKDKKIIDYAKNITGINDIFVVSGKSGKNVDKLIKTLTKDEVKKAYFLGLSNSGKSTLINRILLEFGIKGGITTSVVPNTTTELININVGSDLTLIDTPGLMNSSSIVNYIDVNIYKKYIPKKEIKPKIYNLKKGFMLIIDDIIRIENNNSEMLHFVFYLNNDLKYKKLRVERSEELKILNKVNLTLEKDKDIILSGLGFIKVLSDGEITMYLPSEKIISKRDKLI